MLPGINCFEHKIWLGTENSQKMAKQVWTNNMSGKKDQRYTQHSANKFKSVMQILANNIKKLTK